MKAGKFTDAQFALAQKMIASSDALAKVENAQVADGDALNELYGQGYDYDKTYYAEIAKVTREDVVRVANEIFDRPALRIFVRPEGGAAPNAGSGTSTSGR
jgi:zinc protease